MEADQTGSYVHKEFQSVYDPKVGLIKTLLKIYWKDLGLGRFSKTSNWVSENLVFGNLFQAIFFRSIEAVVPFIPPILLEYIMNYIKDESKTKTYGLTVALGFLLTDCLQQIMVMFRIWAVQSCGVRSYGALTLAIYKKALRLSAKSKQGKSAGEIVNHVSTDVEAIWGKGLRAFVHVIFIVPVVFVFGIYFLHKELGMAAVIGVGRDQRTTTWKHVHFSSLIPERFSWYLSYPTCHRSR